MGFPVGYPEVLVPNVFLHALSLLAWLRSLVFSLFRLLRLSDLLDTDAASWPDHHHPEEEPPRAPTLSAVLIRELLPVSAFREMDSGEGSPPPPCAVCLSEFVAEEEVRCMANCKHMFHRACVDRWIDHDHKTCPLCRTPFVPHQKLDQYNHRLWAASGFSDFYPDQYQDLNSSSA